MGTPYFFQMKDLDTRANFCENMFYPASIKNDNGSVAIIFFWYDTKRTNNYINLKKGQHRGIEDLLKCAPTFLFLFQ